LIPQVEQNNKTNKHKEYQEEDAEGANQVDPENI
jgi:hypothetical protein